MLRSLAGALGAPEPGAPSYFRLYRLDPATGEPIWKFYRTETPDDEAFQGQRFALRFENDVELLGFRQW